MVTLCWCGNVTCTGGGVRTPERPLLILLELLCAVGLVGFYGSLMGACGAKLTKQSAELYFLFIVVVAVIWKMQGVAVYRACRLYSQHVSHQT